MLALAAKLPQFPLYRCRAKVWFSSSGHTSIPLSRTPEGVGGGALKWPFWLKMKLEASKGVLELSGRGICCQHGRMQFKLRLQVRGDGQGTGLGGGARQGRAGNNDLVHQGRRRCWRTALSSHSSFLATYLEGFMFIAHRT